LEVEAAAIGDNVAEAVKRKSEQAICWEWKLWKRMETRGIFPTGFIASIFFFFKQEKPRGYARILPNVAW